MHTEFDGEIFRWESRREDWFFAALPEDVSDMIRELPHPPRGFGSVRVVVRIGDSEWTTSVFPDAQRGRYVLPLKRAVREAEGIPVTGFVRIQLTLRDV